MMKKNSFTVNFRQPKHPETTVFGVTSITPFQGGLAFETEDGTRFLIPEEQLNLKGDMMLCGMSIEYPTDEVIKELLEDEGEDHIIIDHRSPWHPLEINEYGTYKPLTNPEKQYTLLVNIKTNQYVVAFKYDRVTATWAQGHYFDDQHRAMEFLFLGE